MKTSWYKIKLEEALNYVQPTNFIVSNTNYDDSYKVPVLTPGKSFLLGYTDDRHGIYDNVPTIIFDDFTTDFKYVDFPFKVKSSAMKILELKSEEYDIKFLFYLMQTLNFNASEHKRYWISKYSKQIVNVPLLEEQKQIAAILNAADSLRQKDQQLIDHFTALSQSLFLDMFGDPVLNPFNWTLQSFKDLVADECPLTYGIVQPGDEVSGGVAVVRPVDLTTRYIYPDTLKRISSEIAEKYARTKLRGGEILLSVRGSVGQVSFASLELKGANVTRGVVPVWMNKTKMLNEFAIDLIETTGMQQQIKRLAKGATLIQLNLKDLRELKVICPPIELQKSFLERIATIEKQKQQAQASLEKSAALFNSLLQRAFNGELTGNKVKAA